MCLMCLMPCWSIDSVISQDGEPKHIGVDAHRSVCVCVLVSYPVTDGLN